MQIPEIFVGDIPRSITILIWTGGSVHTTRRFNMNVMIKRVRKFDGLEMVTYMLSGGYEVDVHPNQSFSVYTKTGNYAKTKTRALVARAIFEYENRPKG